MRIVAVTSATAGAGKTTIAANVAAALGRFQRRVVLVDAVPGSHVLADRLGVPIPATGVPDDLTWHVSGASLRGVRIYAPRQTAPAGSPAGCQVPTFASAESVAAETEFLVIDTPIRAPGLSKLIACAGRVIVVTSVDRGATQRASRLIVRLARAGLGARLRLVVNGVASGAEADGARRAIAATVGPELGGRVESLGYVVLDPEVPRSHMMQRPVVDCRPQSPSSRCFETLAQRIAHDGPCDDGRSQRPWPAVGTSGALEARLCA